MLSNNMVVHDSQNVFYRSTVGAIEARKKLRLSIRFFAKADIRQVLLRIWNDKRGEELVPLSRTDIDGTDEYFYSEWVTMPDKGCLLWYYFIIDTAEGTLFYGNNRDMLGGLGELTQVTPPSYQITVYNQGAKTPDWFKKSVMYQIFPDRFCRKGDTIIRKKGAVIRTDWTDDPMYLKDPDTREIVAYDFFGGNFQGIISKLDYLQELGISVVYLNPIFESESNHHYDTGDYHKVDPLLGTLADFRELVREGRARGIRFILDGVFSHTGSNSIYFNRRGEYNSIGAYQSVLSPYFRWYKFRNHPNDYDCWWNFDTLPNVHENEPSYMDFIIHSSNSVLHYWLKEGIAGWRLDVIDELPAEFSKAFFAELKRTNPEAVMIGEVWEDASNKVAYGTPREYLSGEEMDSAMNYPWRTIVFDFLMERADGKQALRRFKSQMENYPAENMYAMMNLIGSHDVQRAVTMLAEIPFYENMPAVEQSRNRMNERQYELGTKRLLMATLFQMTYPGVPSVYYGDEIAMQGFKDPFNRRPYDWENGDKAIREVVKGYIKARQSHDALKTGELLLLHGEGHVLAYARLIRGNYDVFGEQKENEVFVVVFNRSRDERQVVTLDVGDFADGVFEDYFEAVNYKIEDGKLRLRLMPLTGKLLRLVRPERRFERKAGILLHPTSLPSKFGVGDFGKEAYKFVDFLKAAGQKIWQILPLGPVGDTCSPYQSISAFAGNITMIDLEEFVTEGWLKPADIELNYQANSAFIDFVKVKKFKQQCLKKAFVEFSKTSAKNKDFQEFCKREAYWLDDFTLFRAAKQEYDYKPWTQWPEPLKNRLPKAIADLRKKQADSIAADQFKQYIFERQWQRLHKYAKEQGIEILGDMPIFIAQDSADVWANRHLFDLKTDGTAKTVAGVPPDYFSEVGQLWGNPQYDWTAMAKENYAWWKARFRKLSEQVDIIRIDHFRGFEAYWSVDSQETNAVKGEWIKGPGKKFFEAIEKDLGKLNIIAEDLGIITKQVEKLRDELDFPGMKILHFMLKAGDNVRMGFDVPENSVIYTGTHDNNTTVGWLNQDTDIILRETLANMAGTNAGKVEQLTKLLIRMAYKSDARMAIIPMQDILCLDERARMNTPGTVGINWRWSLKEYYQMSVDIKELKALCKEFGR